MSLPSPMVPLLQDRLNVAYKTRANLFNWRGQFTPEFVEYLLEEYATRDAIIADPFSGSGTVLLECARRNLTCFGSEINPAAFAMSKFYTLCNFDMSARSEVLDAVEAQLGRAIRLFSFQPLLTEGRSFRQKFGNLVDFARCFFPTLKRGIEKIVALNLLFICESRKNTDLRITLVEAFNYVKAAALSLPYATSSVSAYLQDARSLHTISPSRPNLIITSPPYINVFNYHQNHRAILEVAGWDLLRVATSEFGSNRKNRSNRFKTVIQYCLDMEATLRSCWMSLEADGKLILIIGRESNVRNTPFYNGEMVKDIAQALSCYETTQQHERQFLNKFGQTIKEDVFLFQKRKNEPIATDIRRIATIHLSNAFSGAAPEVKGDIAAAMLECQTVLPSPLFCAKETYAFA